MLMKTNKIRYNFNFQNFKNPNRSFVKTIRVKIQEKFENFQLWSVGEVAFWNFRSHRAHVNKNEKYS